MPVSSKIYNGDQGQRYKIEAFDQGLMAWRPVAYTNALDSAKSIAESIIFRPSWIKSRILERKDQTTNQIGDEYLQSGSQLQ